jgi:hypothetical protein
MEPYQISDFAREVSGALAQLRARVDAVERQVAALAPLLNSDRLEVAKACKEAGATLQDLECRSASSHRARSVNRVMTILRKKGWSLDRIGRATGYSARGIASNLARFTSGSS